MRGHPARSTAASGSRRGFGLIEVMVLVFVLGVGLLALGKTQGIVLRDSGTANNRSIAISLAQEKLEDLRSFKWIDAASATPNEAAGISCGSNGVPCFVTIANNAGGAIANDVLVFPSGDIVMGNTTFNRTWTVVNNHFANSSGGICGAGTVLVTACDTSATRTPDLKFVTVTVSWADQNDADPSTPLVIDPHTVALSTVLGKDDALITTFSAGGGGGDFGGKAPQVTYTKGIAPDVVPVPIGQDSVKKETSKPLPDVVAAGSSVATTFETVTYLDNGSDGTKQVLDDFTTVSCVCEFANPASGAGYPASYYSWDADKKALNVTFPKNESEASTAETVTKNRGVPGVNGQHSLCTKCCNDHHDSSNTATALYDPDRPVNDYINGDHKHYYYANASNPAAGLTEVAVVAGNKYLENCRFLRVDGYYRLMQDWSARDLIVMPKDNYLTNADTLTAYQEYVQDVIRSAVYTDCVAAGGTTCADNNQQTFPAKSDLVNRNKTSATGNLQLLSRAVYVGRIYKKPSAANSPRSLDNEYYKHLTEKVAANQTDAAVKWLDIVPFNEVNTTLLTTWSTSNGTAVTVTNQPIADIGASVANYYGVYSRGLATVTGAGAADIYAYLLPSNSGLTGGSKPDAFTGAKDYDASLAESGTIAYPAAIGIDRHDHRSALRKTDFVNISANATPAINGNVYLGNIHANLISVTVTAVPLSGAVVNCVLSGEGTTRGYSCPVPSGFTGNVRIASSNSSFFFDYGIDDTYNTEKDDGYSAESPLLTNVTAPIEGGMFWVLSPTSEIRGTINCNPVEACNQVVITTSDGVACTIVGGASVVCPVTLTAGTTPPYVWSGQISIANAAGFNHALQANCAVTGTTVTFVNIGPNDQPSSLNMCVGTGTTLASCTLGSGAGSVTIQSGETLTAFLAESVPYPGPCQSQQRTCSNATLSGSYQYTSCNVYTCTTTVSGSRDNKSTLVAIPLQPSPASTCTYPTNTSYSCVVYTGASGETIDVHHQGNGPKNIVKTTPATCGSVTLNFP